MLIDSLSAWIDSGIIMKGNAVIEEIRKAREPISRKCDYSPERLVDYYLKRQKKREIIFGLSQRKRSRPGCFDNSVFAN